MSQSEKKESKSNVEDDWSTQIMKVKQENDETNDSKALEQDTGPAGDTETTTATTDADAMDADGDSEAETLIQSPEKKREDAAESSTNFHQVKVAGSDTGSIIVANTSDKENATRKRKRNHEDRSEFPSRSPSRRSSPLSSPVAQLHSDPESEGSAASRTKTSSKRRNHSETEDKLISPKKRRRRPSEIVPPSPSHKRSKRNSVDTTERRETRSATYPRPSDDEKSPSPEPTSRREHRRGVSTQLTAGEFGEKRKRGRPPLINTRRNRSADRGSEDSDGSEPRHSRTRTGLPKIASHDHDVMSPAKQGPRKWKDKVGRTPLARACNDGDLDVVQVRFAERPSDLHEQDNAKNTPLQIASIEGWEEVVEFLLTKGAEVNVRNIDGDTPLIDAVENGHVPVIKLLLQHGANPRMANMKGYEPSELMKKNDDNYDIIRELLEDAKEKLSKRTPGTDAYDYHNRDGTSSRAASAASPRDSPPIGARSPPAFGSRRRTGRSESTRNDLLYQANTQENLIKLAGKGDVQGVANILSILEKAETESLIAAAKAGHEEVLQLLIAMGKPNPDPDPVRGPKMQTGYNTPMLAAIGRGHPDVVKLLVTQSGFNPTRKLYNNRLYFELAEERKGDKWEEEVKILKKAYEGYKGRKSGTPRKTREAEKSKSRPGRRSSSAHSATRRMPSPTAAFKNQTAKVREETDPEKRKSSGTDDVLESSVAVASDREQTINVPVKTQRTRRSQSDLPPIESSGQEPAQRRRRLVTGKEHRSRQTISTSSENEDLDGADGKTEEWPQAALKRTRASSTPEPPDDKLDRSALKKRKTALESSPGDARSRTSIPTATALAAIENESKQSDDQEMHEDASSQLAEQASVQDEHVKRESSAPPSTDPVEATESLPEVDTIEPSVEHSETAEASGGHPAPPVAVESPDSTKKAAAEARAKKEAEKAEAERQQREKEAREAREAQEREAARLKAEEEEEEAERQRQAAAEEEEKRKQEEERLRKQKEAEELERQQRELESRRRQEQLEQEKRRERQRIENLPMLLARTAEMIENQTPRVKSATFLKSKYLPLYTVSTDKLDALADGLAPAVAQDWWIPSFQVAGLLSTKDLGLSSFPSSSKREMTEWHRQCMWRCARLQLSYDLDRETWGTPVAKDLEAERIAEHKFYSMTDPLFWVKRSDFEAEAGRVPHLKDLKLTYMKTSLQRYSEILGSAVKRSHDVPSPRHPNGIPNGLPTVIHANGIS